MSQWKQSKKRPGQAARRQDRVLALSVVLLSGLLAFGCSKDTEGPGTLQLRIENQSAYTFSQVRVETGGGGDGLFTDIGPGERSEYKAFEYTYRYAYIQAIIGADTLTLQPIDYVGEQRYTSGKFTFQVDIIGDPPLYMALNFLED
ncbi:MAG: hypothetical protein KDC66_09860 [Phaeodactylibacter sp.]|nr:hypothetical protein [Phaeodactylibacter sp.]MCB9274474.1 hypothetical protein [Lewinellaceae bacterium]